MPPSHFLWLNILFGLMFAALVVGQTYLNPKYTNIGSTGTLYCLSFKYYSPNGTTADDYLTTFNFTSGEWTVLSTFRNSIGHLVQTTSFTTAINVEDSILYYNDDSSQDPAYGLLAFNLDSYSVKPYHRPPGNHIRTQMPICSNFPANGTIYTFGSGDNATLMRYDVATNYSHTIAQLPVDMNYMYMIPSFNNRTSEVIFTGYNSNLLPTLYAANVLTGEMRQTQCKGLRTENLPVFYDPVLDELITVRGAPGNISIGSVDFDTCAVTKLFELPNTSEIQGWYQLFSHDQYTGMVWIFTEYVVLTIDVRGKELVSAVPAGSVFSPNSPAQFLPSPAIIQQYSP